MSSSSSSRTASPSCHCAATTPPRACRALFKDTPTGTPPSSSQVTRRYQITPDVAFFLSGEAPTTRTGDPGVERSPRCSDSDGRPLPPVHGTSSFQLLAFATYRNERLMVSFISPSRRCCLACCRAQSEAQVVCDVAEGMHRCGDCTDGPAGGDCSEGPAYRGHGGGVVRGQACEGAICRRGGSSLGSHPNFRCRVGGGPCLGEGACHRCVLHRESDVRELLIEPKRGGLGVLSQHVRGMLLCTYH